jgi:hypothetical protein
MAIIFILQKQKALSFPYMDTDKNNLQNEKNSNLCSDEWLCSHWEVKRLGELLCLYRIQSAIQNTFSTYIHYLQYLPSGHVFSALHVILAMSPLLK